MTEFRDLNPDKVMLVGDLHGNMKHAKRLFKEANRRDIDVLVQVGDFGFVWPNTEVAHKDQVTGKRRYRSIGYPRGRTRLEEIEGHAHQHGIHLTWLDGNHEDFDRMARLGAHPHGESPVPLEGGNVIYLPRGFAWTWSGVRFMAVGGAFSVDREDRTHGVEWWPEETITTPDVFRVEDEVLHNGTVDVLLSHDAPEIPNGLDEFLKSGLLPKRKSKLDRSSRSNRVALGTIAEIADPSLIVHGHYHFPYYGMWENGETGKRAQVIGLERDKKHGQTSRRVEFANSFFVLDLERFKDDPTYYLEGET